MKRFTAIILSLLMVFSLCACGVKPGGNGAEADFTQPEPVTLADGSVVYSKEPFVEFPQTGEYKETALLTNVPGQGVPLLLDMREDGTIDYLFADVEEKTDFQTFSGSGAAYYTIAPDGTATKQDTKWMEDIDHYMAMTLETTQDPNGKWRFLFTAEEGTILILGQYHTFGYSLSDGEFPQEKGKFLYSTLFKVANGQVSIIPLAWEVDIGSTILDLRSQYISRVELEGGQIILYKRDIFYKEELPENLCTAIYNMDGTLISAKKLNSDAAWLSPYWDDTGIFVYSMDYDYGPNTYADDSIYLPGCFPVYLRFDSPYVADIWKDRAIFEGQSSNDWFLSLNSNPYEENDPLSYSIYHHSKWGCNIKAVAQGGGKDFCCWMDEAETGILMRYTHNPEGKIEPEVVTIWSLGPCNELRAAIVEWNATHSSPVFVHKWAQYEAQEQNVSVEEILTRLNLELLNGQGPDVLVLDGLNVDNYLEFMTPLDMAATEGIYDNIKSRFSQGGDLLAVPFRVIPYLLGRSAVDTLEITSLQQFADLVEGNTRVTGTKNDRNIYDIMTAPYKADNYLEVFQQWYPAWADAIWEGGKLNREVLVELLTQTTRLVDVYGLTSVNRYWGNPYAQDSSYDLSPYLQTTDGSIEAKRVVSYPYTLAAPNHVGLYSYWRYANEDEANQKPDPHYLSGIPGPDGTGVMIPDTIVGVRAGGNEEAGQEFVQLLLSREMQLGYAWHYPAQADGYPVIWEYTQELLERTEDYMNQEYTVLNDYEEVMNSLRTVIIDDFLFKHALDAAESCYRTENRLTPEEAAEELYDATVIYLAELR